MSQRVHRLGITVDGAVRLDVMLVERGSGAIGKLGEVRSVVGPAKESRQLSPSMCASPVEAGGGHHAVVGLGVGRLVGRSRGVKPVAELEAGVPQAGGGQALTRA